MENKALAKRFYQSVALDAVNEGYAITLDGKPIRTPQQKMLHTKHENIAQQIAAEWDAQTEIIITDSMPLTRLLNIALDRATLDRDAWLADIVNYLETDLLCYRAPIADAGLPIDSHSEELRALQVQHFDPILAWAEQHYGAAFIVTEGLMPVPQAVSSVQKIAAQFAAANDYECAALALMVPILGSALLAFAVWQQHITVEEALIACRLDESVQASHWGEDAETTAAWAAKVRDVKAAAFFLLAHRANAQFA